MGFLHRFLKRYSSQPQSDDTLSQPQTDTILSDFQPDTTQYQHDIDIGEKSPEVHSSAEIAEFQDEELEGSTQNLLSVETVPQETIHKEPKKEKLFDSEDNQSCPVKEAIKIDNIPSPRLLGEPEELPKPYKFPTTELLAPSQQMPQENIDFISDTKGLIQEIFSAYKLPLTVVGEEQGPVYTRFDVEIPLGFRINRLKRERDNLAFSLGVDYLEIAPVLGRPSIMGLTVKNPSPVMVRVSSCLSSDAFQSFSPDKLPFIAGQTFFGETIIKCLSDGHLLISGSTGSGKTKFIDTILMSLMFRLSPEDLKMILIDSTGTGMQIYSGIPHSLVTPITDAKKAISALLWVEFEIKRRFDILSGSNSRRISNYNEKQWEEYGDELPAIVIIIDGVSKLEKAADLTKLRDSLLYVLRNGAAVGVYVVASTQSLSCFSLQSDAKAMFTQKACLLTSPNEYKKLFGFAPESANMSLGCVQFMKTGDLKPIQLLCPVLTDSEIEQVVALLRVKESITALDQYLTDVSREPAPDDRDELFYSAVDLVVESGMASAPMIQRSLKIGYARAGHLLDQLEEYGYIGPLEGAKSRKILVSKEEWAERKERLYLDR